MGKIAFEVSYDGTEYAGFQKQPTLRTIQGELERALEKLTHTPTAVYGAGRTDAGVHAFGQMIHFTTDLPIPLEKWPLAIKPYLPADIVVRKAYAVTDSFHARYDAVAKTYQYTIDRNRIPNVFTRRYAYHYPISIDLSRIEEAIPHLTGTHDFTAFSASGCTVVDRVRTIYDISIEEDRELLRITFYGNGFLYNMVRILTGTLLEVGSGKIKADYIPEIIRAKDRTLAGVTAPPHGLCLLKVEYPEGFLKSN